MKWVGRGAGALLGVAFMAAGGIKALDPSAFAAEIANYRLIPWGAGAVASLYLPWLEILAGAAAVAGPWRRGGLAIVTALLFVFLAALLAAKARGLDIECGCFGGGSGGVGEAIVRDLVMLGLAALAWWGERAGVVRAKGEE